MKTRKMEINQPSGLTSEILTTLNGLNNWSGKKYCWPSQKKILMLIKDRFNITRHRSTLNRHLKKIEKLGLISRTRRHQRDKWRGMIFRSTLYKISLPGYEYLRRLGINVYKEISILKGMLKKNKEWPDMAKEKGPVKSDLSSLKDILGGAKIPGFT